MNVFIQTLGLLNAVPINVSKEYLQTSKPHETCWKQIKSVKLYEKLTPFIVCNATNNFPQRKNY